MMAVIEQMNAKNNWHEYVNGAEVVLQIKRAVKL